MAIGEIHVGDVGTVFQVTVQDETGTEIDLSTAVTHEFIFRPPAGSTFKHTAAFVTDGSDGQLSYASVAGDLKEAGRWNLQVHYAMPGGEEKHTDVLVFDVLGNL